MALTDDEIQALLDRRDPSAWIRHGPELAQEILDRRAEARAREIVFDAVPVKEVPLADTARIEVGHPSDDETSPFDPSE